VTNREKERKLAAQVGKRERRELGRKAAAARAASRRRREFLKNGGTVIGAVIVVGLIITAFVVFRPNSSTSANAAASASPDVSGSTSASPGGGTNGPLATKPVVSAGTGTLTALKVTTLIQGDGAAVKSGQTITVNYVGAHYDTGEVFDSTWQNGPNDPTTFQIGRGAVIKGWDQGLVGVKIGSRVQLDIPQSLAYPNPTNGQPAGPLRFVVDVLGANDTGAVPLPSSSSENLSP
jgi:peptidylprolyl isomerase